jgi:uncharacterized membrane protein
LQSVKVKGQSAPPNQTRAEFGPAGLGCELVSFIFNITLLALTINLAAGAVTA